MGNPKRQEEEEKDKAREEGNDHSQGTPSVAMSTGGLFVAATSFGGTGTSQGHPRGGGKEESGSSQAAGKASFGAGVLWK